MIKTSPKTMDYKLITDIVFDDIDHSDAPDFCDAYILSAKYDGHDMTEEELDLLNEDRDFVYNRLMEYLY